MARLVDIRRLDPERNIRAPASDSDVTFKTPGGVDTSLQYSMADMDITEMNQTPSKDETHPVKQRDGEEADRTAYDIISDISDLEVDNASSRRMTEISNNFTANIQAEKYKIVSNVVVISLAFFLNFTAFSSIQNLQSSLNRDEGLGPVGVSIIYCGVIISALFLPSWVISKLGCKVTMAVCIVPYVLFMAANLYATWGTIIPAAILVGLGSSPLWIAKCTYLIQSGKRLARLTNEPDEVIISSFFGIFFMVFQSTQISGNLISSFILKEVPQNGSWFDGIPDEVIGQCGAFYCDDREVVNNTNLERPDMVKVYTLCATYIILGILAILCVALLLQNDKVRSFSSDHDLIFEADRTDLKTSDMKHGQENLGYQEQELVRYKEGLEEHKYDPNDPWCLGRKRRTLSDTESPPPPQGCSNSGTCDLLMQTLKFLKNKRQVALIPITIFSGLEQAFLWGDFTRSYVACSLGVWMIGLVLICYGFCDAMFSYIFGRLVKYSGRLVLFALGGTIYCVLLVVLLMWQPHPGHLVTYFVISGAWGVADAVWQTQLNALYGSIFPHHPQAAFSNYRLWESLGFIIAFAASSFVCIYVKLIFLMTVLILGMLGYMLVEYSMTS